MEEKAVPKHDVDVCIAGAGPAGLVLALLLASRGVKALVLERHPDFERDLRGEILQPRFTQLMRSINLFDYLAEFPHERVERTAFVIDGRPAAWIEFPRIAPDAPFMIWMTQPTLLGALRQKGLELPGFDLWFQANACELLREGQRVIGVRVDRHGQRIDVRAKIVVGADGRASTIRKLVGAEFEYELHNIDVLWFLLARPKDFNQTCDLFIAGDHSYLILPKYPSQLQCGMLFRAGQFLPTRARGIDAFKRKLGGAHSVFAEFAETLTDFSPFTLLPGKANFVRRWATDGCMLIGDAAHTCSPAGGIGVSVAIATAIVAAETVCMALDRGDTSATFLSRVQTLRSPEVRHIQRRQHGFTATFVTYLPITRRLGPWVFPWIAKSGMLDRAARRLLTQAPLPTEMALKVS